MKVVGRVLKQIDIVLHLERCPQFVDNGGASRDSIYADFMGAVDIQISEQMPRSAIAAPQRNQQ